MKRVAGGAIALVAAAGTVHAQPPDSADFRFGVAVVAQTRFASDENGPAVAAAPTLAIEIGRSWRVAEIEEGIAVRVGVQVRGSRPPIRLTEASREVGRTRSAGRAFLLDLSARIELDVGRLRWHAGGGGMYVNGPEDVPPFNADGVRSVLSLAGVGEAGVSTRLGSGPYWATATAQAFGITPRSYEPLRSGTVGRLLLGVRLGQ